MSMFSNLFHKNSAVSSNNLNAQSSLVNNPIIANATQMNNEFLHHHKPLLNQQGTFAQAPIAPIYQSSSQSSSWGSQRGLSTYRRGGPYRQFRLRTHSWGSRSENGWSGFNNSRYLSNNISSWEPQSFILAELRAQSLSQRGLAAPFNQDSFWQQWQQQRLQGWGSQQRGLNSGFGGISNFQQQSSFIQQAPLIHSAPLTAPLMAAPLASQPILFSGKQGKGHHHGIRKRRAQAVLPVQPIGGGPAIATIAPAPIIAAPIVAAPITAPLVAPIATRDAGFISAPLHETIVRPTIIQETVRTDRILEVQPVLHREIEQPVVNHIEKHITEAPAANMGGVVRMAPIVQETLSTHVIDEVQPVVHREIAAVAVERVEEHLTEHVVAPTQHTNSVVNEAFIAPVATASPALSSVPLSNTVPITKVVPNFAASPLLLEKQQQAPIVAQPAFGSAMM